LVFAGWPANFGALWGSWRRKKVRKEIRKEWDRFIHALFLKFWERNNRIFNNSVISSDALALKVDL
jgi:hypothetical protein